MSKRTVFTTVTPLPAGISRETVMATLHDHLEMIDLNPLVQERHPIKPPGNATAEEYHCQWYSLTDKVAYLPGGLVSGKVSYNACFHDLANGLQTHVYAPMGLNIRGKWTMGGSLPGEPVAPVELGMGVPLQGLYLREDVDMKCNIMMTSFVKKTLKKAHSALVSRIMVRAQIVSASAENERITGTPVLHQSALARQSTSFSQASSSHEAQSMAEDPSITSSGFLPHITHPQPLGFRYGDAFRDEKTPAHDTSLYPKPLKSRTPSPSMNGSIDGSQYGRNSYQGSMLSSQNASRASYQDSWEGGSNAGPRVSWNQLNNHAHHPSFSHQPNQLPTYPNHAGPPQHQDGPPAYQGSAYPQAPQEQHPAFRQPPHEAPPHPGDQNQRSTQPYPEDSHVIQFGRHDLPSRAQPSRPPPSHGPVELE